MTISINSNPGSFGKSVIVHANWYHFSAGQQIRLQSEESRMLLWCNAGHGSIRLNGEFLELTPEDWLLLPWGRQIHYEASKSEPYSVGGIHIIPQHHNREPIQFEVAHGISDPLFQSRYRSDAVWPGLEGVVRGSMRLAPCLKLLSTFIVDRFSMGDPDPATMESLAILLRQEIAQASKAGTEIIPGPLQRLIDYVKIHVNDNLGVSDLARRQGCGVATIHRLFQRYLRTTPAKWINSLRAEEAARYLRTTNLNAQETGRRIGISDPFQFSRFFKRHHGISPKTYQMKYHI